MTVTKELEKLHIIKTGYPDPSALVGVETLPARVAALEGQENAAAVSAALSAADANNSKNIVLDNAANIALIQTAVNTAKNQAISAKDSANAALNNSLTAAQEALQNAQSAAAAALLAGSSSDAAASQVTLAVAAKNTANTKAAEASDSATNAAQSATNAQGSAATASSQAAIAVAAKDNAGASATAAASSASVATTKATEAGQSALSASTASNTANTKAAEASVSATNAAQSATNAQGSAATASSQAAIAVAAKDNAGASATAAASSASVATTKATEAGQSALSASTASNTANTKAAEASVSATNAAQSATNAQGSAATASSQAAIAVAAKDNAGASAASAAASSTAAIAAKNDVNMGLAAQAVKIDGVEAKVNFGKYENANSGFDAYSNATGVPDSWTNWSNSQFASRVSDGAGGNAMRVYSNGGDNVGQNSSTDPIIPYKPIVIFAKVKLVSGSFKGSGVWGTNLGGFIVFSEELGNDGTPGNTYSFSKITFSSGNPVYLIAMNHYSGYGDISGANEIIWYECGWRYATQAEIQANKAANDIPALSASVAVTQAAIVENANAAAGFEVVVAASGSAPAAVKMKAGKNGSIIDIVSNVFRIFNDVNGSIIEVMKAVGGYVFFQQPISIDKNEKRLTLGSNSNIVLWFGPATIAPPDQTNQNCYFCMGADGKIYHGAAELTTGNANTGIKRDSNSNGMSNNNNWQTIASVNFTGLPTCYAEFGNSRLSVQNWIGDNASVEFRILLDGNTTISGAPPQALFIGENAMMFDTSDLFQPLPPEIAAGNRTFVLQARRTQGSGYVTAFNIIFEVKTTKKA